MAYIKFEGFPDALGEGRTAKQGCIDPDTGEYYCEVDEVRPGEQEVSVNEHSRVMLAAMAAYEAEAAAREAVTEQ